MLSETIEKFWSDAALPALMDFIRVPAKSTAFDPLWQKHGYLRTVCEEGAAWIIHHFPNATVDVQEIEGAPPCLFVEIPATQAKKNRTVAFYGHLDKQPEAGGWRQGLGPWSPVVENDKLYGRGASDDGYSLFAMGTAIRALELEGVEHPRIVGFFETQEESGSPDLSMYLEMLKDRIGNPEALIILDNHCGDYDRVWLNTSLRGLIAGTLRVQTMKYEVHSGGYSGIVPEAFGIAQALVTRLHDPVTGRVKIDTCRTSPPPLRIDQLKAASNLLGDMVWSHAPLVKGVRAKHLSNHEILLQNTWEPALTVIGIDGLPRTEEAGNVIQGTVALRLSMRVPPAIDLEKAMQEIKDTLTKNIPYHAHVTWSDVDACPGWCANAEGGPYERLFNVASRAVFGHDAVFSGQGGSIGFLPSITELFPKTELILAGVLGPDSNAHAPNESLDLTYTKRLIEVVALVLSKTDTKGV